MKNLKNKFETNFLQTIQIHKSIHHPWLEKIKTQI